MSKFLSCLACGLLLLTATSISHADTPPTTSQTQAAPVPAPQDPEASIVKSMLEKARVAEHQEQEKKSRYLVLPGGVYNAPLIVQETQKILERFKKSGMIDPNSVFDVFLASSPEVNLKIEPVKFSGDLPAYHVVITKGFIDLITGQQVAQNLLGPELADKLAKNSEAILAAALAHDVRHAITPIKEGVPENRNQMHVEFEADEFAVKLLYAAGYPPGAMILYLEPWVKMQESGNLDSTYVRLMDDHPAARFRIANIEDLVQMLKMMRRAREEMGFDTSQLPVENSGVLRRDGPEQTSKTSVDTVRKKLKAGTYQNSSLRDKLHFLEQYLVTSKTDSKDPMIRQSAVALAQEYVNLLKATTDMASLDTLIASFTRFETNLKDLATETNEKAEGNVRKALSEAKTSITARQLELLKQSQPDGKLATQLDSWGEHVDKRVVYGNLIQQVNNAQNLDDLKKWLFTARDDDFHFKERFKRAKDKGIHDYRGIFYEKVAVRALALTQNMDQTLDFLETNFLFNNGNGAVMEWVNYVFAGLSQYVLTHDHIQFGKYNERMSEPKTAKDRIITNNIAPQASQDTTFSILMARRGKAPQGDFLSKSFQYGLGRRFHRRDPMDTDTILFLDRALGSKASNFVFNDLIQNQYTLGETLDLLNTRDPQDAATWDHLKKEMPSAESKSSMEIQSQIRVIRDYIQNKDKSQLEGAVGQGLTALHDDAGELLKNNILTMLKAYAAAPEYKTYRFANNPQMDIIQPTLPDISQKYIAPLNTKEKVEIFSALLRTQTEILVQDSLADFETSRPAVVEAFGEMTKFGIFPAGMADEFLGPMDEMIKITKDLKSGQIRELPGRYFVLRRRVKIMLGTLSHPNLGFFDKLTEQAKKALRRALDMDHQTLLSSKGMDLLQTFLVPDKEAVLRYFKDPSSPSPMDENFALVTELAKTYGYFRGIENLDGLDGAQAASVNAILALKIHAPYQAPRSSKKHSESRPNEITFDDGNVLGWQTESPLLPLGPVFRQFIEEHDAKTNSPMMIWNLPYQIQPDLDAFFLYKSTASTDSVASFAYAVAGIERMKHLTTKVNEETIRLYLALMTRSLSLVKSKEEMDLYSSLISMYVQTGGLFPMNTPMELLKADPKVLMDISSLNYRQHFFDFLIEKMNQYGSWKGQRQDWDGRTNIFFSNVLKYLYSEVARYDLVTHSTMGKSPLLFRIWGLKKLVPPLVHARWYIAFINKILLKIGDRYASVMLARGTHVGNVSREKTLTDLVNDTPWSEMLDESLAEYIKAGDFEKISGKSNQRNRAIKLTKLIRSLRVRDQVYRNVLATYGDTSAKAQKTGLMKYFSKDFWTFLKIYRKAEKIWGKGVLERLKQVDSVFSKQTFEIVESAWEQFAGKNAAAVGLDKNGALALLKDLWTAFTRVEAPLGSEIAEIFPEASRYRDPLLEDFAKDRPMTFKQLNALERYKSDNTESPYHRLVKILFELNDRYMSKLTPVERAQMALYLANFDYKLDPDLEAKMKKLFYGSEHRRSAIKSSGFFYTVEDIKTFFRETHPEERLLAFRAMFVGGVSGHADAQKLLTDRLLMSDPTMPKYLRKLLTIHLNNLNESERSMILSWILANGTTNQGANGNPSSLTGPDIVKLFVEKGGVAAAKLAQIIASHGFKLPKEYQDVLEVFKGNAQKVDKIQFMRWAEELLPRDKFVQIAHLDRQLGSGSLKIGYLATLTNGKKVAIMIAREYVEAKTAREFEVLRADLTQIMVDPEMRLEPLPGVENEMERIIRDEMKFKTNEAKRMALHKQAYDARPFLIKHFGNRVTLNIPQPLEGWGSEKIIVEDYVEAAGWSKLPQTSWFGWSKTKLAKAALNESMNQLLAYMDPKNLPDGQVIIDIDPHEENELAQTLYLGLLKKMVNIDLGQSVQVQPEVVRNLIRIVLDIHLQRVDAAMKGLEDFMSFRGPDDVKKFREELETSMKNYRDPIEILTKSIEESELSGIGLKTEFLYFQKLFATMVGLQKQVKNPDYLTHQAEKILALRAISAPKSGLREIKTLLGLNDPCLKLMNF